MRVLSMSMMMFMLMVMSAAKKQQARRYVELYGDLDGFYGYRDPYARRYRHGMDPLRAELFWNEFESGRFGRGRPFRGGGGFQQLQYEDDEGDKVPPPPSPLPPVFSFCRVPAHPPPALSPPRRSSHTAPAPSPVSALSLSSGRTIRFACGSARSGGVCSCTCWRR